MLGPEHEYSLVNKDLNPLPISDKIIKDYCGKIINFIEMPCFTFGKEMQLHVMEIKANQPFKSPFEFEETMQTAVSTLNQIVQKYGAMLLGTGMHPLLKLAGHWHLASLPQKNLPTIRQNLRLKPARMAKHPELPPKFAFPKRSRRHPNT